jgi:HK97 family phage major capsid protein
MEIQQFVRDTANGIIPVATLTTIAADRRAFGDDVLAAFRTQIELRSSAAQTVLETATQAGRDTLLASEQRSYDAAIRERDAILGLQRHVESRTESRAFVPATQTATEPRVELVSPVLTREQRCADWVRSRGGRYVGEPGAEPRFGAVVRALALGDRHGLSALEQRALSEGSDAAGGFTVPEVLSGQFIDRVRNAMVVMRAGAQTVPMTSDTLHLARLAQPGVHIGSPITNAAVGAWKVENDPISEADLTLERVTFTARTLPLLIKLSVELSEDSTNIDAIIEREMAQSLALELDRVALVGSGSAPEPRGIVNQANVQTDALGSPAPANWDFLVDAAGAAWAVNHEPNSVIWSPTFATTVAKFKSSADDQPLRMPAAVEGITQYRTNQVGSYVIVGDFSQLMIGLRTSFRLEVSRQAGTAFENLQIAVRAYLRADVQLAHPEAFVVLS